FPSVSDDPVMNGVPADGGLLPNVRVTDLDLSLSEIDPTTGRPRLRYTTSGGQVSTAPDVLLASTFGRGMFAIRIAPVVFSDSQINGFGPRLAPDGPLPGDPPVL